MKNTMYLAAFFLSLTLSSCGSGEYSATDTGSASFGLKFEEASDPSAIKLSPSMAAPADICSSYGIDTISGTVYNSSNTVIATGGPWACSAHQGTINNIPPGSNLRIAIKGSVSGSVVWQGETTGATIYAGQDTNVGSITMTYIGNDTTAPTLSSVSPSSGAANVAVTTSITATFSENMAASTIDTSTFTLKQGSTTVNGSVTYDATTKTATFTPSANLSYSTTYTATITTGATDMAGNAMANNYSWSFTTTTSLLMGGSIQSTPLNLTSTNATVTTFVGSAGLTGSTDATSTAARFNAPHFITTDGTNLFVADYNNHTIRKIVISTGAVTTIAGSAGTSGSTDAIGTSARFNYPHGIATDGTNLFVSDRSNHTIRKIVISTGAVTTIAGSAGVVGSTDGTGTVAKFNFPYGITTDGTNLFVADSSNHTIRKIVISTGVVTTIAGSAGSLGATDGTGTAARFNVPNGITTDGTNLFVADSSNYTIRKIVISTGVVTTIAGSAGTSGSTDGTGTSARFWSLGDITTDGTNLYVNDFANNTIRKVVISTGVVTTIAGSAGNSGSTDGTGTFARFYSPTGITTDGINLFVTDYIDHTIRKIQPTVLIGGAVQGAPLNLTGTVTTFAGLASNAGTTDGTGTAVRFNNPSHITTDGTNLFIADLSNHTIRKVVISTGAVTTLAGSAGNTGSTDGTGTAARFNWPDGITTDGTNLFVCDALNYTVRKVVISTGVVTTLAGTAGISGSTDGIGTAARFYNPAGITTDGTNLFVSEHQNHIIRKIVISTGEVTTIAGSAGITGSTDGTGTAARFNGSYGIITDGTNLFICDTFNHTIRKMVISTGVVTTIAGAAGNSGSTDGTGTSAKFNQPAGITTDGTNLFISDYGNHTIRKMVIATGVVTTIAGSAGLVATTDGVGSAARFNYPRGITTDGTSLFETDYWGYTIRRIQ